jgi:hypothetical protein
MAKRESITVVGRDGETYRFRTYIWGHEFKPLPAVYIVAERQLRDSGVVDYQVLYIGQTSDLSVEFKSHKHSDALLAQNANIVGVLIERDAEKRIRLAHELGGRLLAGRE